MNKKIVWVVVAVAIVLASAGVVIAMQGSNKDNATGSSMNMGSQTAGGTATPPTATNSVTIENFAFSPVSITVKKGTTVTWTNQDSVEHTVTIDGGSGPKSELFGKGQTYSYTFDTVGSFPYHCQPHPNMRGTVTVTE